ncbi:N-acetylglucosamine-6-phosphate deacetylase [Sulfurimonas aquatica]|uniref:N-acetylglucosamine-6-phosphate deacetylase n=1 Tax=Sulfurimonas aquatica TaxID=2672570 RepID=A0A975GC82_9BACT|nr:N-acetylglucosamine-6-phosphate deacetylase [Sulfurimonas aquatica]QSZ41242.1 N-acetylglucosamine-6-phosphate deacetylase [Sulfurimonas aquatica]
MMYAFVNCDIFNGSEFIYNKALVIDGEKIHGLIPEEELDKSIEIINLNGKTISPGFIDLQVNGGNGILFNDEPTIEAVKKIYDGHKKFGTTDFLPTFITGSLKGMKQAVESINKCLSLNLDGVLGIHFEGPFLNQAKAGVHEKKYIRESNVDDIEAISKISNGITMLTLAPEVVPSELILSLQKKGIFISIGHTNATYEEAMNAFSSGASCSTHLYNAMTSLESRAPGVVGASLDNDKAWTNIIVDGIHSSYASVRVAMKAKAKRKLFLVTDAMPPVGGEGDDFRIGDYNISVKNGKCVTMGDTLAGSSLDMASAVRNCIQHVGIDKGEALRMASTYPAEFIKLDNRIGHIKSGYDANLAIFNNQIQVSAVVVKGKYELFT